MAISNLFNPVHWRESFSTLVSRLIIGGMMACFAVTLIQFGNRLFPSWNGNYLIFVAFLVSIESMYTQSKMKFYSMFTSEWLIYRGSEWIIILLFLKLALYLTNGIGRLWLDIPLWRQNFGANFFTNEYILVIMFALFIWAFSARFSEILMELVDKENLAELNRLGVPIQRSHLRRQVADMILFLGMGMILITALLRVNWQVQWLKGVPPREGVYNLLVYFLLALVLLSLTQYSILRIGWRIENIPFSHNIPVRWALYTFIFILSVAVIAGLLPTHYSIGLLTLLNYLLALLVAILQLIFSLLSLPIFLLLYLYALLMGKTPPQPMSPAGPQNLTPSPPSQPAAPIPWLEALKSIIFWILFLGVIGFSFYAYFREHRELAERMRKFTMIKWLAAGWRWLWSRLTGIDRQMRSAVYARWKQLISTTKESAEKSPWQLVNPRRLDPRRQILFFYLAMVRRGAEIGLKRQTSQTPSEYSQTLQASLPATVDEKADAYQDIEGLTDRFLEARYSRHDITLEEASNARRYWERLRSLFRKARRI